MGEVSAAELDPRLRKQLESAAAAIESGNAAYAIPVCAQILKGHPGCFEARQVLRKAQLTIAPARRPMGNLLSRVGGISLKMKSGNAARKHPEKGIEQAEAALTRDPGNRAAHELLGTCAEQLGWRETAVFAYETVRSLAPADLENLKRLARALLAVGRLEEAVTVGERILEMQPGDPEGQSLVKKASVEHSLLSGRWEEGGGYRGKLHDEATARQLEQAGRAQSDDEGSGLRIGALEERLRAEPGDVRALRELAELHRRAGRWEAACAAIERALQTGDGRSDTTLERALHEYRLGGLEAAVAGAADAQAAASARAQVESYRMDFARRMAERYPADARSRFEYGELLLKAGAWDDAVSELQNARRDPQLRGRALLLLGRAYAEQGFHDLALKQYEEAKGETSGMNDFKMEVIYEAARSQEALGNREAAAASYKELYSLDINFRDVAEKVKGYYAS